MIKVIYNKTCGRCVQSEPLTSGMVGQTIEFEYSPDFDGLTLTAVFTNGKTTVDVLNPGNQCVIPHEALDTVGALVKVGIYATNGDELVIPTVYAHIGVVQKGADPSGDVSADPTLPVWVQTQAMIGNLNDLNTEAKSNLVAAINEAAQTGGGGSGSTVELDTTLTQSGKAADAKAVGDRLSALSEEIANLQTSGLTTAQAKALDGMFKVAAYIKADVSAEYTAFKEAFEITDSGATLIGISVNCDDIEAGTPFADIPFVVKALYDDGSAVSVSDYTVSDGIVQIGSNTATISYRGFTENVTFNGVEKVYPRYTIGAYTEPRLDNQYRLTKASANKNRIGLNPVVYPIVSGVTYNFILTDNNYKFYLYIMQKNEVIHEEYDKGGFSASEQTFESKIIDTGWQNSYSYTVPSGNYAIFIGFKKKDNEAFTEDQITTCLDSFTMEGV